MSNSFKISPAEMRLRRFAGEVYQWHSHLIHLGILTEGSRISLSALYEMSWDELYAQNDSLNAVHREFGGRNLL